jgi:hypothetical protein
VWKHIQRLFELEYYWSEYLADKVMPENGPTPFWLFVFRMPVHLYAWDLQGLVSKNVSAHHNSRAENR